ncbi:hypothetical protein FRC02_008057 [Tulasnella sp. 418]|nr:hypothetical protein FRC02_008057 [Tulasnella sp. 418]
MPKPSRAPNSFVERLLSLVKNIEIFTKRSRRKSILPKDLAKELDNIRARIQELADLFPGKPWLTKVIEEKLEEIQNQLATVEADIRKIQESGGIMPSLSEIKSTTQLSNLINKLKALGMHVETARSSQASVEESRNNPELAEEIARLGNPSPTIVDFTLLANDSTISARKMALVKYIAGSWSEVWQCELSVEDAKIVGFHKNKPRKVAYKTLVTDRSVKDMEETDQLLHMAMRYKREREAWKGLNHPNIAPLLGLVKDIKVCGFISPWYANGSFETFPKGKSFFIKVQLLQGAADGLAYLHSEDKIHGDLRPPNVLVDDNQKAKLIDFGGTVEANIEKVTQSRVPNLETWMAPERMGRDNDGQDKNLKPTKESDTYCFGLLCIKVITEAEPNTTNAYHRASVLLSDSASESEIEHHSFPPPTSEDDWRKKDALGLLPLVQDCWAFEPTARPSMAAVARNLGLFIQRLDNPSASS